MTDEQIETIDADGNGYIEFCEFVRAMMAGDNESYIVEVQTQIRKTLGEFYALFELFDASDVPDGQITLPELLAVMRSLGLKP